MKILKSNENYSLVSNHVEIKDSIDVGIYDIEQHPMSLEFSLVKRDYNEFNLPNKIYGSYDSLVDRVVKVYEMENKNLGVLFVGEKGTGKTLLAKQICNTIKRPVLILDRVYKDGNLHKFLTDLNCEVVLFIDEFEKTFKEENQEKLLSLMDGTNNSKILFLLTANHEHKINGHIKNRPSRVRYFVRFTNLSKDWINEVIEDTLINKEKHKDNVDRILTIVGDINYDLLKTVIEEVNRFDDSEVNNILNILNVKPSETSLFLIKAVDNKNKRVFETTTKSNLLKGAISLEANWQDEKGHYWKDSAGNYEYFDDVIMLTECENLEIKDHMYTFDYDGIHFTFERREERRFLF
jgi:DNA replication protein DnaC